jgi:DNA invertase Pin-like site-specific DNA recombinase
MNRSLATPHSPAVGKAVRPEGRTPKQSPAEALSPAAARMPAPAARHTSARARVVGYTSIDPERPRPDYQQQADQIVSECKRRGLRLVGVICERDRRQQRPRDRPALEYALRRIVPHKASGIVVADLSRLTRSVTELGRVLEWFARRRVRLVVAALPLDTDEEHGRLAAQAIIEIAAWERRRLAGRTRKGRRDRRKGPASVADYPELKERIAAMRSSGMTLQAIADRLNAEGVSTVRGGAKWRPSSVHGAAGYERPRATAPFRRGSEDGWQRRRGPRDGESASGRGLR